MNISDKAVETLKTVAAIKNTSVEGLLHSYVKEQERYLREYEEDKATLEAMKTGDFITQEEMFTKMDRLAKEAHNLAQNAIR
ncbi:MAG: hypothetical protein V3T17_08385 [Pseudomonadales bacterium]